MKWKDAPNSYKYECLMSAAILVVLAPAFIAFLVACIAAIIYAPWPIKVLASLLLVSCTLGAASAICNAQWKRR